MPSGWPIEYGDKVCRVILRGLCVKHGCGTVILLSLVLRSFILATWLGGQAVTLVARPVAGK